MIPSPPSLQRQYTEYWSGDVSFEQAPTAPRAPADDAPADELDRYKAALKAHQVALEEHQRKVRIAVDTGDWSTLLIEGGPAPTRFEVKPLTGKQYRWLASQIDGGKIDLLLVAPLAFRCCLVGWVNAGDQAPEWKAVRDLNLGTVAPESVTDYLDSLDLGIVTEIGVRLFSRATHGLSPPS